MRKKDLKVNRISRHAAFIEVYEVRQQTRSDGDFETIAMFFDRSKAELECSNRLLFHGVYGCHVLESHVWL